MTFVDILESCLNAKLKSQEVLHLIQKLQNEIDRHSESRLKDELNYDELFSLFVVRRKIKLLRFLFGQKGFRFGIGLFLRTLDLEAYDIAALLHKEFFRMIRNVNKNDLEEIINCIIISFSKSNGMVDFKCYLVRQFIDKMQQRHTRQLISTIDNKVKEQSKQNILVLNLNVAKTACLLIELLNLVSLNFHVQSVRCKHTIGVIMNFAREYLRKIEH